MKTEIKILKAILKNNKEYTIRELSLLINSDYKITHTAVKSLIAKKILEQRKAGNSSQIKLLLNFSKEILEAESERTQELLKNKNMKIIYEKLSSLHFQFISLIFGSYAKDKAEKNSDIDIMIISEKNNEKDVSRTLSLLPLNIHLTYLDYEEFLNMARTKEFNVVSEAINHNFIIFGIEDYYRLIKNAR